MRLFDEDATAPTYRSAGDVMKHGKCNAVFSRCEHYRYTLSRHWDPTRPVVAFIGLNPSTADKTTNDNTVTRCINFGVSWGMGSYVMLNAYAFRATKPENMKIGRRFDDSPIVTNDPTGPRNDDAIRRISSLALRSGGMVIAAWGNHCEESRASRILSLINGKVHCLDTNKSGAPKHPLYVKNDTPPQLYWRPSIFSRHKGLSCTC